MMDNQEKNTKNIKLLTNKTRLKKNIVSKKIERHLMIKEVQDSFNTIQSFYKTNIDEGLSISKDTGKTETQNDENLRIKDKLLINSKNKNYYKLIGEILEIIKNKKNNPYNPTLIRGNNETSKTFILEKIKNILNISAYYINAKELSLYLTSKEDIKNFIKDTDLYDTFIIDDIHTIEKDAFLQEELCFILDMFLRKNKNIIISNNTEKKHKELSKELFNRISMGLVITLPEPDLDIKMQYVELCFEENNMQLNKELSLFTARKCQSFRKIRSAIINIKTFYNHLGYLPNIHDLETILKSTGNSIHLDYEYIMSVVGKKYGFTSKEIKSEKRDQRLIEARQISMYLARNLLGDTYQKIGKHFGGKDHTTVIYSIRKIEKILVRNKDMNNTVTELSNLCKS